MKEKIDIREAFTLWDLLKSKYTLIDFLNTLKNRAHDADLKILLGVIVKEFQIFALKVENYQKKKSLSLLRINIENQLIFIKIPNR